MNYSPILLRLLAILLAFFSFFSFLGVISTMTGVANNSSVYFLAVHSGNPSFSGVLIFILVSMGYAVYVTLWSLFQMQFAGMMHLVPHRTSAVCLSFNARMCARLAAPLAFFYLGKLLRHFCVFFTVRLVVHSPACYYHLVALLIYSEDLTCSSILPLRFTIVLCHVMTCYDISCNTMLLHALLYYARSQHHRLMLHCNSLIQYNVNISM